jgi:hypothetical protein
MGPLPANVVGRFWSIYSNARSAGHCFAAGVVEGAFDELSNTDENIDRVGNSNLQTNLLPLDLIYNAVIFCSDAIRYENLENSRPNYNCHIALAMRLPYSYKNQAAGRFLKLTSRLHTPKVSDLWNER